MFNAFKIIRAPGFIHCTEVCKLLTFFEQLVACLGTFPTFPKHGKPVYAQLQALLCMDSIGPTLPVPAKLDGGCHEDAENQIAG